jgi:hypothetical protein
VRAEHAGLKRSPQVDGVAERLFGAIVEVVAEAWSDLALQLNRRAQPFVPVDNDVPFLGRPIESGDFDTGLEPDVGVLIAGEPNEIAYQVYKSV